MRRDPGLPRSFLRSLEKQEWAVQKDAWGSQYKAKGDQPGSAEVSSARARGAGWVSEAGGWNTHSRQTLISTPRKLTDSTLG